MDNKLFFKGDSKYIGGVIIMKKLFLVIRIIIEGFMLWIGSIGLWFLFTYYFYSPIEHSYGQGGGAVFYTVLTIILAAATLWILIARRKEIGDKISTATYVILNLIPFMLCGIWIWLFMHSFD